MKGKLFGAVMLIILIVVGALAYKFISPLVHDKTQRKYSDAKATGTIRVALDNWIGYFPFRSKEMKAQLRNAGWLLEVVDDEAKSYTERLKLLADGKYTFAVATVDSHILNDFANDFASVEGFVIDESKGSDCILAREDRVKSFEDIKGNTKLRIAFTSASPSEHFGKATSQHLNLPELMPPKGDSRRIETGGSKEAIDKLIAGTADIAIGWEPDVSRALSTKGIIKLLGTEDTTKLVVDVLLFPRDLAKRDSALVETFFSVYFKVLKHYQDNPDELRKEVKAENSHLSNADVDRMIKGVRWVSLTENCEKWFGISAPGTRSEQWILDTIESAVNILIKAGDFKKNPLPNKDPARIVYSVFLEKLYNSAVGFTIPKPGAGMATNVKFSVLDEKGWQKLREVRTLKLENVVFRQGITELDDSAKEAIEEIAKSMQHYPNFRFLVKGHTSPEGDKQENLILSQERADAVKRYLNVVHNIDINRLKAIGFGGEQPLTKLPDETNRSWYYRLARVELVLVREEI